MSITTQRRRGDRSYSYSSNRVWYSYSPVQSFTEDHAFRYGVWFDQKTGVSLPGWQWNILNGIDATTGFTGLKEYRERKGGSASRFLARELFGPGTGLMEYSRNTFDGDFLGLPGTSSWVLDTPSEDASRAYNLALSQFYKSARQAQTNVQLGVVAGELGKTIRQVANPMRSLRNGLVRYLGRLGKRTRRTPTRKKALDIAADSWLEYSYGITPLISDIAGAWQAFSQRHITETTKVVAVRDSVSSTVSTSNTVLAGVGITTTTRDQQKALVIVRGAIRCEANSPAGYGKTLGELNTRLGLTAGNFLPTIWELIPYSFLVDYFANTSEIIDAVSFSQSDIAWMNYTTIKTFERRVGGSKNSSLDPAPGWPILGFSATGSPGSFYGVKSEVVRSKVYDKLIPSLTLKVPNSFRKLTNLAALGVAHRELVSLFNRKR